jgi:hypothetical protein
MIKGVTNGCDAGVTLQTLSQAPETVTSIAHVVRRPDERAVLVSERSAVWDRPAECAQASR